MCFYIEADWSAELVETTSPIADKPFRCHECGETIQAGESYYHVFMQEHECCRRCEDAECSCVDWNAEDCDEDHECKCEKPDYGESFTYRTCHNCRKFLEAVGKHELDEGCRADESRPGLGDMLESLRDFDAAHLEGYYSEAGRMFPELEASGYLERLKLRLVREEY